MAKTNSKGFFCDHPCGCASIKCQICFCAGCATGGIPLIPNTEYPEYTKHSQGIENGKTTKKWS